MKLSFVKNSTSKLGAAVVAYVTGSTGPAVTTTESRAAAVESCRGAGCIMAPAPNESLTDYIARLKTNGVAPCYAWRSQASKALVAVARAAQGPRATVAGPLARMTRSERSRAFLRLAAIGDSCGTPELVQASIAAMAQADALGLPVIAYTHAWRHELPAVIRSRFIASVNSESEAAEALTLGWKRVARVTPPNDDHAPRRAHGGGASIVCPAIKTDGRVTCDRCKLCDASRPGPTEIRFPTHGPDFR